MSLFSFPRSQFTIYVFFFPFIKIYLFIKSSETLCHKGFEWIFNVAEAAATLRKQVACIA